MSDCFDHYADAMDGYISDHGETGMSDFGFVPSQVTTTIFFEDILAETEKAILVQINEDKRYWIPNSQIKNAGDGWIEITKWVWDRLKPLHIEKDISTAQTLLRS